MWVYHLAAFLSAFLLFQIQPMMCKALLPGFGGSYLVWATCVFFFQGLLFLGYLYSHAIQRFLGVFRYARWHLILVLLPVIAFPFDFRKISDFLPHTLLPFAIPCVLFISAGLPFFVLCTTSPILQCWLYRSKNPYILYSTSNLGSLLALLTYPIIFEPLFNLKTQGYLWWSGYFMLGILFFICTPKNQDDTKPLPLSYKNLHHLLSWFVLSASGCVTLLAITNMLTFDVASVPLLWVLPLSVYLMTFILLFKSNAWNPKWMQPAFSWAIAIGIVVYLAGLLRFTWPVTFLLPIQLGILFIICMNCHGRLIQAKPTDKRYLTAFYIALAAGGVMGSFLISSIIPLITKSFLEYPGSFFLAASAIAISQKSLYKFHDLVSNPKFVVCAATVIICLIVIPRILIDLPAKMTFMIIALPLFLCIRYASKKPWILTEILFIIILCSGWTEKLGFGISMVKKLRNFYGIYSIYESGDMRYLRHGTTIHGRQYIKSQDTTPLSYYHPTTPIGEILSRGPFKFNDIGMVGLGTGALAAYFGKGQAVTVFELDPDNLQIAEKFFSYLDASRKKGAGLKFITGDGRISLKNVPEDSYDILILDAFNSNSIPVHLLTLEAIKEYFRVLKPDGLIFMHISNRAFNLSPVIYSAARGLGLYACEKDNSNYIHPDADSTNWMALCRDKDAFLELIQHWKWESKPGIAVMRPWTDQYINLFHAISFQPHFVVN